MNYIDILILIPLLYAGWKGFKHGLIIEVFTLLALVVGLYAGIHFSDYIAGVLKNSLSWRSKYVPVVAFTITFLGVGAMVYFAGKAIEKVVKITGLTPINKGLGIFFSILKMLYFISVILVLIESSVHVFLFSKLEFIFPINMIFSFISVFSLIKPCSSSKL